VTKTIHGIEVVGVDVDPETRCLHYRGPDDVIAVRFACCGKWFSCHQCHAELADHVASVWPRTEFETPAILCGACGRQLTIREYLACESVCPRCRRQFNADCARHHHFYFAI
jgi:uncharacterized CHY-type Zn-finger protein